MPTSCYITLSHDRDYFALMFKIQLPTTKFVYRRFSYKRRVFIAASISALAVIAIGIAVAIYFIGMLMKII